MSERKDDPAKMEQMRQWVQAAAKEIRLRPETVLDVEAPLLKLIGKVAHGPTRPGAPLTAYLAGYAAGKGEDPEEVIASLIAYVDKYQA